MCLRLLSRGCVCCHVAACNGMFLCRCCPVPAYAVTCPSHLLSTNVCCDVLISISCLQSPFNCVFLKVYVRLFVSHSMVTSFLYSSIYFFTSRIILSGTYLALFASHLLFSAPCTCTSHYLHLNQSHFLNPNHSHSMLLNHLSLSAPEPLSLLSTIYTCTNTDTIMN